MQLGRYTSFFPDRQQNSPTKLIPGLSRSVGTLWPVKWLHVCASVYLQGSIASVLHITARYLEKRIL